MHIKAYAIADKYDVMALCEYSSECFTKLLDKAPPLRNAEMFTTLLTVVPEIYSSTPNTKRHLRQAAVEFVRYFKSYLTEDDEEDNEEDDNEIAKSFWELLNSVPSFSADLVKDCMITPCRGWCFLCPSTATGVVMELRCSTCNAWSPYKWNRIISEVPSFGTTDHRGFSYHAVI